MYDFTKKKYGNSTPTQTSENINEYTFIGMLGNTIVIIAQVQMNPDSTHCPNALLYRVRI